MRRWFVIGTIIVAVLISSLMAAGPVAAAGVEAPKPPTWNTPDTIRLVVKFERGASVERAQRLASAFGGKTVTSIPQLNALVVAVPEEKLAAALAAYRSLPDVQYVEQDGIAQAAFTPNDPEYTLHQYGPEIINAAQAWDITQGSADILVGVVDTGADFSHPDLADKLVAGWDFANNDNDPSDDNGHGTHVSGIIAAATNNGIGIAGVGFNTRVLVVKSLNAQGSGYYSTIAQGITYAADQGARIINLSLRGTIPSSVLEDAVKYATSKGVLVVAAAGNDGSDSPVYPAAYPETLAVAATDWNDQRWGISNFGDFVDVAAPGVGVYSTDWAGGAGPYASRSGTSMAAPHVAGVAALVLAANPNLTADEVRNIIESTAKDLGDPGWDPYYGYGRVDAYQAVLAATQGAPQTQAATLGDRVWIDANGNGVQDAGEVGLPDVTLSLHTSDGTLVATTVTDNNGQYVFTDVAPGDYYIQVTVPTGYVLTSPNQGSDEGADSDVDTTTSRTALITVAGGETLDTWDVGFIPLGHIAGIAWIDPNANAVKDANETTYVPGVPVHVTGTDVTGASVDVTVQTDNNGAYRVEGLLPGAYTVEVPYQYSGYVLTTSNPQQVTLDAGQGGQMNVDTLDFGYIAPTLVDLTTFQATAGPNGVKLVWEVTLRNGVAPEFEVWRSTTLTKWEKVNDVPVQPVWDDGRRADYRLLDTQVEEGETYYYRLSTGGTDFGPWSVTVPNMTISQAPLQTFLPFVGR